MLRQLAFVLAVTSCSFASLVVPQEAIAGPLTRAVIESLRNQVRLIPQNQSARSARPSDAMNPGDSLATARASAAQLRFNDGSLARLGEQAVFRFTPGTRSFTLSNGTVLMLIPPGQGTTRVRTPNAAAGIRGSALFVRYIPETETTLVGALTTSGIEVFNDSASQRQELKAGNMAVIVKDRIERVYEFDLNEFYRTSELVKGLDLTISSGVPSADEAIAKVQAETAEAAKTQAAIIGTQVIENPSFVQLSASTSGDFPNVNTPIRDDFPNSRPQNLDRFGNTNRNATDVRTLLEGGQIRDTQLPGRGNNPAGSGGNGNGRGNDIGRGNAPGVGNNPPGVGGNGNGRGNPPGVGNNPPGVGGNGNGQGNGNNNGRGNVRGNNPVGVGGNGNGRGNATSSRN